MDESGDVGDLWFGEIERRHAAIGAAVLYDGSDELAILIVKDELSAQEIGAAFAAAGIGAVAEGAIHSIEGFAAIHHRGVGGWALRIGGGRSASTAPGRRGRRRGRRLREQSCGKEQDNPHRDLRGPQFATP
jgi:hypothetical protein